MISLVRSCRSLSLALLVGSAALIAGCHQDDTPNPEGTGENPDGSGGEDPSDPGSGTDPNAPPQAVPKTCDAQREQLVAACNYVHTYAENTKDGLDPDEDPYRPTEECKVLLHAHLTVSGAWTVPEYKESHDGILAALHTMFFHPLVMPKDLTLLKKGGPQFSEGEMLSAGVQVLPDNNDVVLRQATFNEKLFERWVSSVNKISPMDSTANMATSNGGLIEVDYVYAKKAYLKYNAPVHANKYIVARSFYHELRHAEGFKQHTSCDDIYVDEVECDDTIHATSYGGATQFSQALALGALYTRREGSMASIAKVAPFQAFYNSCRYGIEKVNDLAEYMKANSDDADPCSSSGEIWTGLSAKKYVVSTAGGPKPVAAPDPAWTCESSILPKPAP